MANTSDLKIIKKYVIEQTSRKLNIELKRKEIYVSNKGRKKGFDGVSPNADVVVQVINHGGYTSGGKLPSGKIRSTYADCYFLSLSNSKRKILILTNKEFYDIFKEKSQGLLGDIELIYSDLPENLRTIADNVEKKASKEMTR